MEMAIVVVGIVVVDCCFVVLGVVITPKCKFDVVGLFLLSTSTNLVLCREETY